MEKQTQILKRTLSLKFQQFSTQESKTKNNTEILPAFLSVTKLFVGEGMHNLLFPNQDAKPREFRKQNLFPSFCWEKDNFFLLPSQINIHWYRVPQVINWVKLWRLYGNKGRINFSASGFYMWASYQKLLSQSMKLINTIRDFRVNSAETD